MRAFIAQQTVCANAARLLLACMERASSSLPNNGGDGSGGGAIARSALTHLAGACRVNSANYSTCLHRLARATLVVRTIMTVMAESQSGAEEGQGAVGPAICHAGVPAVEMACGVDPGTLVLEESDIQKN
jgi:hypothetical protein